MLFSRDKFFTLRCIASGDIGSTTATWLFNQPTESNLREINTTSIKTYGHIYSYTIETTLTLDTIDAANAGQYSCQFSNEVGQSVASTQVTC